VTEPKFTLKSPSSPFAKGEIFSGVPNPSLEKRAGEIFPSGMDADVI